MQITRQAKAENQDYWEQSYTFTKEVIEYIWQIGNSWEANYPIRLAP